MKKYLLLVAAFALFAACSEKEQINETTEIPIDFTKSYVEKGTKAIYTTQNFETTGNTMGVFGWKKKSTTYTATFENKAIDYNQTVSNDWGYSPKKYWDSTADYYLFYGYAPHSSALPSGTTVAMTTASDPHTFSISGFTQNTTVASQIDLLVDLDSQKENHTNTQTTKTDVAFTFNHILTQVNIKMGVSQNLKDDYSDNPVQIQSVTLSGAYINGTYSYSSSAWQWSSRTSTHDFQATPSTDAFFSSNHLTATAELVPGLKEMLLIPGSVTGYTISVSYTIGSELFERTINLTDFKDGDDNSLSTWAIGYNYTYQLIIGPDPIEFGTPDIDDWGTGGTYYYNIE